MARGRYELVVLYLVGWLAGWRAGKLEGTRTTTTLHYRTQYLDRERAIQDRIKHKWLLFNIWGPG